MASTPSSCSICHGLVGNGVTHVCQAVFHLNCYQRWLATAKNCPRCGGLLKEKTALACSPQRLHKTAWLNYQRRSSSKLITSEVPEEVVGYVRTQLTAMKEDDLDLSCKVVKILAASEYGDKYATAIHDICLLVQ